VKHAEIRGGRQSRRRLAVVLLGMAVPCLVTGCRQTYGPGDGSLTGIITRCTSADIAVGVTGQDNSKVVTVSVQNKGGQTVGSQRLPLRTSGARYRMRLLAGSYVIGISTESRGYVTGDTVTVPANETTEEDFDAVHGGCV
jgi:hypothetical protein